MKKGNVIPPKQIWNAKFGSANKWYWIDIHGAGESYSGLAHLSVNAVGYDFIHFVLTLPYHQPYRFNDGRLNRHFRSADYGDSFFVPSHLHNGHFDKCWINFYAVDVDADLVEAME